MFFLLQDVRKKEWTAIIPNSQLIVIPYPQNDPRSWSARLYLTPSNIVLLTAIALIGVCVFILVIIGILHWQEKKADDREKRQEAHRFHFDAMWGTRESVVGEHWEDWVFHFSGVFIFTLFPHWSIFMHLIIHLNMTILNSDVSVDLLTSLEKKYFCQVCLHDPKRIMMFAHWDEIRVFHAIFVLWFGINMLF